MRKSPALDERTRLKGLCVSCCKASHCTFLKDFEKPILQCDEFEGYPCKPNQNFGVKSMVREELTEQQAAHQAEMIGLCVNCRHRETCTFPRPAGGVWRCDEYE
jgi:hypothetical protein